jgi:hypothetical protein
MDATLEDYKCAIISVRDKEKDVDLTAKPRDIINMIHMYSNTKTPVPRFILDGAPIKRNNSIVIGYKCLKCDVKQEITLNLYIRKVKNNVKCCDACKNLDEIKRAEHVAFMKGERIPDSKSDLIKWSEMPLDKRMELSQKDFDMEDDDFKSNFNIAHFTKDEFDRIRGNIISIGNGKLKDLSGWEYFPYFRVWNQTKYTPMLIDRSTGSIEKPCYIEWKCDVCEANFTNRDLEVQKNKIRILCSGCGFCNRTFKVKSMNTPWGKIRYQSQYEYRFINWCVDNNVIIANGPQIEYTWDDKPRKYSVDFQLPEYNKLIELKDNHVWHRLQVESGKWGAKEMCAKKWCEEKSWEYEMIFPKTMASWKDKLIESRKI